MADCARSRAVRVPQGVCTGSAVGTYSFGEEHRVSGNVIHFVTVVPPLRRRRRAMWWWSATHQLSGSIQVEGTSPESLPYRQRSTTCWLKAGSSRSACSMTMTCILPASCCNVRCMAL